MAVYHRALAKKGRPARFPRSKEPLYRPLGGAQYTKMGLMIACTAPVTREGPSVNSPS